MEELVKQIEREFNGKYEFYNYNHALEILSNSFLDEWNEIKNALHGLQITVDELLLPGGNESPIPPKFNEMLEPLGWQEVKISGDLIVRIYPRKGKKGHFADTYTNQKTISNYIDGHNIDFVKGRVALDVEWNSKDQTFDRDLFAMRTYHECDIISVGIIITRSQSLNNVFRRLNIIGKYGASTTWMGKLLPRLDSRRHGGCPILAIGIKEECIEGIV
jgi:CRISPR-associated protein Csd2